VKQFLLMRGVSGKLYLFGRELWKHMSYNSRIAHEYEFITDNDDPEVLKQMQALVNKDIEVNK